MPWWAAYIDMPPSSILEPLDFHMRSALLIIVLVAATPPPGRAQEFHFGSDLSYVNQMEDCGAIFREGGEPKDVYAIFADRGNTLVRVRLWVDPYWWQAPLSQPPGVKAMYSDLSDVRETIQRAKAAGMQVLLDFHYSDFWADPGRQLIPKAWVTDAYDLEAMKGRIYTYTSNVLSSLNAEGLRTAKSILKDSVAWMLNSGWQPFQPREG